MKILVVGSGGREHAIALKLKENPKVEQIFAAPGNGGMAAFCTPVNIKATDVEGMVAFAKENGAPYDLVVEVAKTGKLPVVNFAAGGIATPADAALMMQLGSEGIFVGSGIFKSSNPEKMARAIVKATAYYNDPDVLAEVSEGLGEAMRGIELSEIAPENRMAERGW